MTSDSVSKFFDAVAEQNEHPALHRESGTLRLDLRDGSQVERWYVTLDKGDVSVTHSDAEADAVVRAEREQFADMIDGTVNVTAALLRGAVAVQGNLGLVASFARLLPGPSESRAPRPEPAREG